MKNIKWFLTGVSIALLVVWVAAGGFSNFTENQIVLILITIGTAFGVWLSEAINKCSK